MDFSALASLIVFVVLILSCFTLARVITIKNDVKFLKDSGVSDWFKIINVPFELSTSNEVIKTFIVPDSCYLINTNALVAFSNVTFDSSTTLLCKAATSRALLDSSPDLFNDNIEIFDGVGQQTSGTSISLYNQSYVNIGLDPLMEQQTIFISLKLSHAPSGGPLKIEFVGNFVNVSGLGL
jgi:hypothetical protein